MAEFNTNPGDSSVTELEREVDRERERVSATLDELQARASVGSLVDQLAKAVGENGGEVSRNLGRSLRDNPLAALLTGSGLPGLWQAQARGAMRQTAWEDQERDFLRPRQDRLSETPFRLRPTGAGLSESWQEPGYPDKVLVKPRRAASVSASPTLRAGSARASPIRSTDVRERPSDVAHSASAEAASGRRPSCARPAAPSAMAPVPRVAARLGRTVDMRRGLDTLIEEQPLVAGAIAMALGAAVGGALPRSEVEDPIFGGSDRAMGSVRNLATEQGAKVQATASAVVDEAVNIAGEASANSERSCHQGQRSSTPQRARSAKRQVDCGTQVVWQPGFRSGDS